MSNYSDLKSSINAAIRTNGANAITGAILQSVLNSIVNSIGAQYQFVGVAQANTNPGTPDYNVAYLAGPGTYQYFGGLTIAAGRIGILKYNGTWQAESISLPSGSVVSWEQNTLSGTKIASITINGDVIDVYAPSGGGGGGGDSVSWTQVQQSGTKIATITINGNPTDVYAPTSGGGGYQPDNEDIALDANDRLKFANRASATGKLGYVIVRTNQTFAQQVTEQNTIYEIRYDFNLSGASVTIPAGSVLVFNGGRVRNGYLICSDGVKIYRGNFVDCPLLVRGNFEIRDSVSVIDTPKTGDRRDGCIICEGGGSSTCYVNVIGCSLMNNVQQNVYGCCVKVVADNHSIWYRVANCYLTNTYHACIETQASAGRFANGNVSDNIVLMSGSAGVGEGLGVSVVAANSKVVVADNYIEARGIGIEFSDSATITGNVVKMADTSRYAIQSSLRNGTEPTVISGNHIMAGRVGVVRTLGKIILTGNEINGVVLFDGREYGGEMGLGDFVISDNLIIQTDNDKTDFPALTIYFNNNGTGLVEGNRIFDKTSNSPYDLIAFSGLKNCRIVNNVFSFSATRSQPVRFLNPTNVEFSDNLVIVDTLANYGSSYAAIDPEDTTGTPGTYDITLSRNTLRFGNISSIIASNYVIYPVRDGSGTVSVYEDETTIVGLNQRKNGTTANRPSLTNYAGISRYFDTTLNKPIWWNRSNWRDAAGSNV